MILIIYTNIYLQGFRNNISIFFIKVPSSALTSPAVARAHTPPRGHGRTLINGSTPAGSPFLPPTPKSGSGGGMYSSASRSARMVASARRKINTERDCKGRRGEDNTPFNTTLLSSSSPSSSLLLSTPKRQAADTTASSVESSYDERDFTRSLLVEEQSTSTVETTTNTSKSSIEEQDEESNGSAESKDEKKKGRYCAVM